MLADSDELAAGLFWPSIPHLWWLEKWLAKANSIAVSFAARHLSMDFLQLVRLPAVWRRWSRVGLISRFVAVNQRSCCSNEVFLKFLEYTAVIRTLNNLTFVIFLLCGIYGNKNYIEWNTLTWCIYIAIHYYIIIHIELLININLFHFIKNLLFASPISGDIVSFGRHLSVIEF